VAVSPPSHDRPANPRPEGIGEELLSSLRAELTDERARHDTLGSRALTLSAASATSIALLYGLGSDYSGRWQDFFFAVLLLAGLCLLAATVSGWSVVRISDHDQPDLDEFDRLLNEGWNENLDSFRLYVADGVLTALKSSREIGNEKAADFKRALGLLFVGSALVAVEIAIVAVDRWVS